jgi:hypothetical protein
MAAGIGGPHNPHAAAPTDFASPTGAVSGSNVSHHYWVTIRYL